MHLISCWAMTQTQVSLAFKLLCLFQHCTELPWWLSNKESTCNAEDSGDLGLIPGLGRSPGEENGNPLHYSCLWNSMDRGAWQFAVYRFTESYTAEHTHTLPNRGIWYWLMPGQDSVVRAHERRSPKSTEATGDRGAERQRQEEVLRLLLLIVFIDITTLENNLTISSKAENTYSIV